MKIGRGDGASIRIVDRTVSRLHARITIGPDGPLLDDAGFRFGTLLSGSLLTAPTPLHEGARIRMGDAVIRVESDQPPRATAPDLPAEAGETIVVPVDATLLGLRPAATVDRSLKPRVRSGWALKRLGVEEGEMRFVLRDLRGGTFLQMNSEDAALFELVDGEHTVAELLQQAERTIGPSGPARFTGLIAELADRGLLGGVGSSQPSPNRMSRFAQVFKPQEHAVGWVGDCFEQEYAHWGRVFCRPLAATFLALLGVAGFGAFMYIVGARYGTPFVVASRLLLGGLVFILGRFALVAAHETAHGLALTHYGRRAVRAGLRVVLIFPFAFGVYVGAYFNLNPFLDRDGHNIMVDVLGEPRLLGRARRQLAQKLSGSKADEEVSPVLARYAITGLIWTTVGAVWMVIFSTRYFRELEKLAPHGLVLTIFIIFWALLLVPVAAQLGLPIWRRIRFGTAEVNRVVR
jgi:putative peptide zinc metalloprotease protein